MSELNVVEKLKKEVVGYFDKYLADFEKKCKLIEKTKNEVLKGKGDLQKVLDMFANHNIEIAAYQELKSSFRRPMKYAEIKPYAEIVFIVKKPDNDVLLNIRARYAYYEGKFNVNGKYSSRTFSGYELNLPNKGAEAVPENSAKAKSIKECINSFKNKHQIWLLPSVEVAPPDKIEDELFFHMVNSLLSIKTPADAKKFKNFTALEIKEGMETLSAANNLNEKSDCYSCVFR